MSKFQDNGEWGGYTSTRRNVEWEGVRLMTPQKEALLFEDY